MLHNTAKILIDEGENVDIAEIALRAGLDHRTAIRCRGVVVSVIAALRDAKLLPAKATPKKAPTAPAARIDGAGTGGGVKRQQPNLLMEGATSRVAPFF